VVIMSKTKIYIETFGCQMNISDTERVSSRLRESGYELIPTINTADVIVFNTCSVRAKAEHKVLTRVGEIRKLRGENGPLIGIMGCVAQLEGESIFKQVKGISFIAGTRATNRLPFLIRRALDGEKQVFDLGDRQEGENWEVAPVERHSEHIAFIPIIEGCNKFCTYCIVPYSRGRERSRLAVHILQEVNNLANQGFKEIHLIGQNVNSYRPRTNEGMENFRGATPFSRLLRAVASTGIPRIKFTTSFPRDFHKDIISAIEENENLCNWVHLPLQSGSARILRAMRRGYKIDDYKSRIDFIKKSQRKISITSDIIIGFPGESDVDFMETLNVVQFCQYDGLYIFKYSERRGTPAAKLANVITESVKTERFHIVEEIQKSIQNAIYTSYIGSKVSVLVEGTSARAFHDMTGHTSCNKVINFPGGEGLTGKIIDLWVTQAKANSLYGVTELKEAEG
jgi:tRNA-2-methylthio-N6-dimethylallyladenosine synthase